MYAYVNGEYLPGEAAKISVIDHGFLYGDAVFDDIMAYKGHLFKLDEHVDRLYQSAATIRLDVGVTKSEMKNIAYETLTRSGLKDGFVRILVTRGVGYPLLDPRIPKKPSIIVIAHDPKPPAEVSRTYTESGGRKVIIASTRKVPSICVDSRIKSVNYLNNVLARIEAIESGADDAIMLDFQDFVAEGPGSNICVVKDGLLYTPPPANRLDGITLRTVLQLAKANGHQVVERNLTAYDLYTADEVFSCATSLGGVTPIGQIDGRPIGKQTPGPITKTLMDLYRTALEHEAHDD